MGQTFAHRVKLSTFYFARFSPKMQTDSFLKTYCLNTLFTLLHSS